MNNMDAGPRDFVSTSMARRWDDGLVAGTGTVGAVLHGTPDCHVIDVAHEEFFFTIMDDRPAPTLAAVLPVVQRLMLDGDAGTAAAQIDQRAAECGFADLIWTDPFVPAASVTVVPSAAGTTMNYRRTSRFDTGEISAQWDIQGASGPAPSVRLSVLPLRIHDAIVVRIASRMPLTVTLSLHPTNERTAPIDTFAGVDSSALVSATAGLDGDALTLSVRPLGRAGARVAHTRLEVHPRSAMGTSEHSDTSVQVDVDVRPGEPVHAIVAVRVDRDTAAGQPQPPGGIGTLDSAGWDELVRQQRAVHGALTGRSGLELAGRADAADVETLMASARAGDPPDMRALIELAYAAGRHTIISATGTLPPNLQGVWQGSWTAPWSSDYTMNGNLQTAVAALGPTGTPELLASVFRLLDRFADHFHHNAQALFGVDGSLLPARVSTHGHANHFGHYYPHEFWIGNGGWMLRLAYDYFAFTGDRRFVADTAWPLAQEVMSFYTSALVTDAHGQRHAVPCFSPENTPAGATTPLSVDATSEIAMIRDAARVACRLADLSGAPALAERWTSFVETLPPYRVAPDGSLAEWLDGRYLGQPGHRHASHLYPLWYEPDPAFGPAERTAAAATVAQKLAWRRAQDGPQEMAFGIVQLGLAAAHLGDAETSRSCVEWLVRDHFKPNMVSTHDEGGIFNVDASGGVPALIAAMLLQSTVGELRILPALPAAWPSGRVTGLRGRGGIIVDELVWAAGEASMSCRFVAGSEASRPDDVVNIMSPPHLGGDPRAVQLDAKPTRLRFATGQV
jgi:alpha-L-fucosidase 2